MAATNKKDEQLSKQEKEQKQQDKDKEQSEQKWKKLVEEKDRIFNAAHPITNFETQRFY